MNFSNGDRKQGRRLNSLERVDQGNRSLRIDEVMAWVNTHLDLHIDEMQSMQTHRCLPFRNLAQQEAAGLNPNVRTTPRVIPCRASVHYSRSS
jgi:hypothetical protein